MRKKTDEFVFRMYVNTNAIPFLSDYINTEEYGPEITNYIEEQFVAEYLIGE